MITYIYLFIIFGIRCKKQLFSRQSAAIFVQWGTLHDLKKFEEGGRRPWDEGAKSCSEPIIRATHETRAN